MCALSMVMQFQRPNQGNPSGSTKSSDGTLGPPVSAPPLPAPQLPPPKAVDVVLPSAKPSASPATTQALRAALARGESLGDADLIAVTHAEGLRISGPNSQLSPEALARVGFSALAAEFKKNGNMAGLRAMERFPLASEAERAYVLQPGIDHRRLGIPAVT